MENYIILELIPTATNPAAGEIVQLSAIKVNNFNITSRFDWRVAKSQIRNQELAALFSYDAAEFTCANTSLALMQAFQAWAETFPLFIINNAYTAAYLNYYQIANPTTSVFAQLNTTYHDGIIEELMQTYNLAPSNHIVDLLFEALIYRNNANITKQTNR